MLLVFSFVDRTRGKIPYLITFFVFFFGLFYTADVARGNLFPPSLQL
jgi:hypothetical protein